MLASEIIFELKRKNKRLVIINVMLWGVVAASVTALLLT